MEVKFATMEFWKLLCLFFSYNRSSTVCCQRNFGS